MADLNLTYLGTATLMIEVGALRLLTDPVFDPPGSYENGPVTLRKTDGPTMTAGSLGKLDAILLSHDQHSDNLDVAGRALLPEAGVVLTTPEGADRLGGNAVGLAEWHGHEMSGGDVRLRVTAVPAQHGPDGTLEATGPVTGFVLDWGDPAGVLYISGDTVPFAGLDEITGRYAGRVAVAVVHLGHVQIAPMGETRLSMSAAQAAELARSLGAARIVPIHYEGWTHFREGRDAAEAAFAATSVADRVTWLAPGARTGIVMR